jgi:hypothetical protein
MKVDTKDIPGLRDLSLDTSEGVSFTSELPSEAIIRAAYGRPDFGDVLERAGIGRALTSNAASANRWAQGIGGVALGVPSKLLPAFREAVGQWGPAGWQDYATGSVVSQMDLGLRAMGSIPLIGWAAGVALELVRMLVERSQKRKPPPPNLQYVKDVDELQATRALRAFYDGDLRRVFLPPGKDVTAWRVEPAQPGFEVQWDGEPLGLGVLPGESIVAGQLVSYTHWDAENYLACNAAGTRCEGTDGQLSAFARASVRRDWPDVFQDTVMGRGELLPSLRRVGAALWSQVSSTQTAAAFNLDTRGIAAAWYAWSESKQKAVDRALGGGVKMYADRYVGFRALQKSRDLTFYGVQGGDIAAAAKKRVGSVYKLQMQLLDTLAVAYASESQPAFRSVKLADKLRARRAQLLTHPARWRVAAADISDVAYRSEFEAATAGDRPLTARVEPEGFSGRPSGLAPLGRPDGPNSSPAGIMLLALAAAGLAAFSG